MPYKDIVAADQRLHILQVLEQDSGYSHNEHVIKQALASVGHNISSDALSTQLHWLHEQDLVELEDAVGIQIARLTQRGADVATGAANVPGVARPRPE